MTANELAQSLTAPQRACLLAALRQDPTGEPIVGKRRRAVFVDRRARGRLLELDLLGWSEGFDDGNTLLPLGREVAALLAKET